MVCYAFPHEIKIQKINIHILPTYHYLHKKSNDKLKLVGFSLNVILMEDSFVLSGQSPILIYTKFVHILDNFINTFFWTNYPATEKIITFQFPQKQRMFRCLVVRDGKQMVLWEVQHVAAATNLRFP